ncbi:hypothetical protein V475_12760 [Sphingobium baderi LL03]|uniref:Fe2OG dioxygenase domain-containing protein n=2 Tax=Sphingobium baderi TaxID=1332080 RepID=T0G4A3_9SPHN|nr:hypothetical protein [Sphingobium baderi]EQA98515.1 hypothetical protein L485_17685 [Sphingobium baderi LL03]KMS61667.1 hypothetical protein V475_12760 [Sphingobium baderi LL03]WRD75416.1 hypothetical protein QQ987_11470 [Sphingobium baderi]
MPPIAHVNAADLAPGALGACFHDGAAAVVMTGDPGVASLWRSFARQNVDLPWQAPLYELSANLRAHDDLTETLGDVFYFKPGRHAYIARKIEICAEGLDLVARPTTFHGVHGDWTMATELREACWRFAAAVMTAIAPREEKHPPFRAVVQQLKYHESVAGHEALFRMVHNSLGSWGRIGYRLDQRREEMRGPLGRRGVCDALALMSLIPLLRGAIDGLNGAAAHLDPRGNVPAGYKLIIKPHIDTRYFSALCGSRHNLRTEIFVDGQWLPLPISQDDVVIFPGSQAHKAYGIAPTLHRVIQARDAGDMDDAEPSNITLLLGAK